MTLGISPHSRLIIVSASYVTVAQIGDTYESEELVLYRE